MYDTSSSSCSESEDEGGEENSSRLSRKLQGTPSLAKAKGNLPLHEPGEAPKISDVLLGAGVFTDGAVFIDGVTGGSREGVVKGKQGTKGGSTRAGREYLEKEVTRKQIKKARQLGSRQIFKRAIMTSSSSSEDEDEQRVAKVSKRWNIICSDDEEDVDGQERAAGPDTENNSRPHTASKNVDNQEAEVGICFIGESTPPSSSLGPSPNNSPAQHSVQEAINLLERDRQQEQGEQTRKDNDDKRKNEMLDEMILRLLEERERRCEEEGERELLRIAAHWIACRGCDDTRCSEKFLLHCFPHDIEFWAQH